jgi:hypothetical protein
MRACVILVLLVASFTNSKFIESALSYSAEDCAIGECGANCIRLSEIILDGFNEATNTRLTASVIKALLEVYNIYESICTKECSFYEAYELLSRDIAGSRPFKQPTIKGTWKTIECMLSEICKAPEYQDLVSEIGSGNALLIAINGFLGSRTAVYSDKIIELVRPLAKYIRHIEESGLTESERLVPGSTPWERKFSSVLEELDHVPKRVAAFTFRGAHTPICRLFTIMPAYVGFPALAKRLILESLKRWIETKFPPFAEKFDQIAFLNCPLGPPFESLSVDDLGAALCICVYQLDGPYESTPEK